MAALSIQVPYPVFYDRDGQPLDNGNIYIGDANLDPVTNPLQVYYDEALTIPASQPLKTSNGYIYRNGTPAQLYVNAVNFSILVNDAKNTLVYSFPDGTGISPNASNVIYNEGSVGAVDRTVQNRLQDYVSIKDFGAVGDGVANDLAEIQAALNSGAPVVAVTKGIYNLGGGTLTVPLGSTIYLAGGVLTNGTIACDNNFFDGFRGLSSSITLTGVVGTTNAVSFDWFVCEKSTKAAYDTFINGANPTFGTIPAISAANRTILTMLITAGYEVQFGAGIYPFDTAVVITKQFCIVGLDRSKTLLWAPNSSFFTMPTGYGLYPYAKQISIEAKNNILYTKANTTNAIHGLILRDSFFVSYEDHAFWNDRTVGGGTGCPIYGSKITDCAVYAGAGKGCFVDWGSNSNVYDNVVDHFQYFNNQDTNKKGIALALFYNSSTRDYCNSNISYSGLQYVAYYDRLASLFFFNAHNNTFESNPTAFQAILKVNAASSNIFLNTADNFYIGNSSKENGYAYILLCGNTYLRGTDSPTPLYGDNIRNQSDQYVRCVTTKIDSGGTKYRLLYLEPQTQSDSGANAPGVILTPSAQLATLVGMEDIYAADSANISFIQVTPSYRMVNSRRLAGGYGTTAARPTFNLYVGYPYYDTTLNKPIVYDGTNWRDGAGAIV